MKNGRLRYDKINVAIVDDNEKMVSLLDAILQTDKNIEVIGRGDDGVQALDIIKNQEPDVVLFGFDYAEA